MALGPGKYDAACTVAREMCKGEAAILIVLLGKHGSGFSIQATPETLVPLPDLLRKLADDIERSLPEV